MINLSLSLFFVLCSNPAINAESPAISFDTKKGTLMVGGVEFNKKMAIDDYIEILGDATSEEGNDIETNYIYEEYGITLTSEEEVVKAITLTFNTDGDENFAQNAFTGKFKIGDTEVNTETLQEEIQSIKGLSLKCMGPQMCFGAYEEQSLKIMMGFNENQKLTQMTFFLK